MIFGYLFMCFVFGTTYLAIKVGLEEGISPFLYAGLRFFIAALLVLLTLAIRNKLARLSLREYGELMIVGFLMTTVPFAALFWAEQYISSGTAAILVATAPVFTTLISIYAKQIHFRWYVLVGLLLSVAGAALIVSNQLEGEDFGLPTLLSKLFIVFSEIAFSFGVVRSRKFMKKLTPFAFNGYQMLFASLVLLLLSVIFEPFSAASFSLHSLASLFYLAVVASILASTIYYWLVKETNATFPTTWTYVAPVIAMVIGALFLGEAITFINILGSIGVLLGIILLNWETWVKLFGPKYHEKSAPVD